MDKLQHEFIGIVYPYLLFSGFRWISDIPSGEEFGLSTVVAPAKARDFL